MHPVGHNTKHVLGSHPCLSQGKTESVILLPADCTPFQNIEGVVHTLADSILQVRAVKPTAPPKNP